MLKVFASQFSLIQFWWRIDGAKALSVFVIRDCKNFRVGFLNGYRTELHQQVRKEFSKPGQVRCVNLADNPVGGLLDSLHCRLRLFGV